MIETPLSDLIFENARWRGRDAFPSTDEWKWMIEEYLSFLQKHNQLERYKPRLNDNPQIRDETIAEIQAAYFVETFGEYPIIAWEPPGASGQVLEFRIKAQEAEVDCEVKSPGWEREVIEEEGHDSPRLKLEKHINGDVKFTGPWLDIRNTVKKAYPKFKEHHPSLLIINDDIRISPILVPHEIDIALFCAKPKQGVGSGYLAEDGCFVGNEFQNLGGVLFIQVDLFAEGFKYRSRLARNPNALSSCALPESLTFSETYNIPYKK